MITAAPSLGETAHRLTRKGHDLRIRVSELAEGARFGHVLVFGEPGPDSLVRIHSRCLYGDALGSDDCDCGAQLAMAMDLIQAAGSGVLIYLEQEGRGLGLIAKALGYQESQRSGADTFASYENLGFAADVRTYTRAAKSLLDLGLSSVRLLTNNPDKISALREAGIAVHREPLLAPPHSEQVRRYLEAKRVRRGHLIDPFSIG